MISDFTIEELQKRDDLAAKAAEKYADYVHQKTFFEQLSKDFLAALKFELASAAKAKPSDAELEMCARATPQWKEFRAKQMEELKEAGRRQIQFENRQRRWDTARSALSMRRSEVERIER